MSRIVIDPPFSPPLPDGTRRGGWWHESEETGRIVCDLCPRECHLKAGDRGFCFVRENRDGEMVLTTYGRSTGFCIDPIEKKPLNHFLPGTSVLSFGTAGCNLGCKFCQNHDISKAREVQLLSEVATPEAIAEAAVSLGCASVACTYNDPVIWAEYAIDTAKACRARGIRTVAVTAGYITPTARAAFFQHMDAANVDLKGFSEEFYQHLTLSHLQPVLDTLVWLKHETDVWLEITNLIIPAANDTPDELRRMCDWILQSIGDETPVHFTAFHPDYKMLDRPRTPKETLLAAHDLARSLGLKFVYVGNVDDVQHQSTYCPGCGQLLIERNWYELGRYHLDHNRCQGCGRVIPGVFDRQPGTWGRRRQPIDISHYLEPAKMNTPDTYEISAVEKPELSLARRISQEQHQRVHALASEIVAATLQKRPIRWQEFDLGPLAAEVVSGAYVSLKRQHRLRSCCGFVDHQVALAAAILDAAQRSAQDDVRLPPISLTELPVLQLETWLLDPIQEVLTRGRERLREVTIGRHGLMITRGQHRGLLLPGVATEHGYDAERFLRQVCRKAGLEPQAWESSESRLFVFEGTSYSAPLDPRAWQAGSVESASLLSDSELHSLHQWFLENVGHHLRGSAPNYYSPTVPDGMIHLVAGLNRSEQLGEAEPICQLSIRPAFPLQATLFQLAQVVARQIQQQGRLSQELSLALDLVIGLDLAMHGTTAEPDLAGFDPSKRALIAMRGQEWSVCFEPQATPSEVLQRVLASHGPDRSQRSADLLSCAIHSTRVPVLLGQRLQPVEGPKVRSPAVAGKFYPADAAQLQSELQELFRDCRTQAPISAGAVLVPHAGWRFSGRLAAEVLAGTILPKTLLVLGPKHTAAGVHFAVAPHETWQLPGADLQSDLNWAQRLVAAIPEWQWDTAAHAGEHAIEVELPLIHYCAPESRVVGAVLGPATWEESRSFGQRLAELLAHESDPPLFVISSDMNHFATDEENRRLDSLALDALCTCDPEHAFRTIREHKISMCGLVPAVIVMEALRTLGRLTTIQRVNYATSADVTGERERVVGYAGLRFLA